MGTGPKDLASLAFDGSGRAAGKSWSATALVRVADIGYTRQYRLNLIVGKPERRLRSPG